MIYLKEHNLLFLKPFKTAGTSVEIALSCNASESDIVTPFGGHLDDEFKRIDLGGQMPCNWAVDNDVDAQYRKKLKVLRTLDKLGRLEDGAPVLYADEDVKYSSHMTPPKLAQTDGAELLRSATYVTMSRHPYEQVMSLASWRNQRNPNFNLPHAIDQIIKTDRRQTNQVFYFDDDQLLPDFVIRYEHLDEDLQTLESKFDLKLRDSLPVTKRNLKKQARPATEVMTDEQKEACYLAFGNIFDALGYER